jgi:hypothetical protein
MPAVPLNYIAILVAAVVAFFVSFLWYGPLFGKKWMKLMAFDAASPEKMAEGKKKMPLYMAIQFIGTLLMAFALDHSLIFASTYLNASGIGAGLMGGFWSWLGFVAPVTIGMVLWEGKPWTLWLIVASNWLVNLLLMGAILAWWM